MDEKLNVKREIFTVFWVFVIGCFFGSCVETVYELIIDGTFHVRTGLIYGAFIPVYGCRSCYVLLFSKQYKRYI